MESPSSTVRRQAWIHSRHQWTNMEELDPPSPYGLSTSTADDDVFSDGCCAGKIESWLLGCGLETCSANSSHLNVDCVLKASNSFEDDLSLGADASALNVGETKTQMGLHLLPPLVTPSERGLTTSTPHHKLTLPSLNLGHSISSSCLSSSTSKTTSTVSDVLELCSEDAEETLYQLGFGSDELQANSRIPPRFFTFPSQLQGINFRLFLESQLQRIRQEDPSLSLASRFRQVEVLTAMANAFYSLYSHVSRTPLQKLPPPEFSISPSPTEKYARFMGSVRKEPRSPVERLKDMVSKMCLYTGGSPRGSDSTSPQPSPRKRASLPNVVGAVLGNSRVGASKKLDLDDSAVEMHPIDRDGACERGLEEQMRQTDTEAGTLQFGYMELEMEDSQQSCRGLRYCRSTQCAACEMAREMSATGISHVDGCTCEVVSPRIDKIKRPVPSNSPQMYTIDPHGLADRSSEMTNGPNASWWKSDKPHRSNGRWPNKFCSFPPEEEHDLLSCPGNDFSWEASLIGSFSSLPPPDTDGRPDSSFITVGNDQEVDSVASVAFDMPDIIDRSSGPPIRNKEEPSGQETTQYQSPLKDENQEDMSTSFQQAVTFESEEVPSIGTEDLIESHTS